MCCVRGLIAAVDSDYGFVFIEPLEPDEVRELFDAAAPAFREPSIGRKLRGLMLSAGLVDVSVMVMAGEPDTQGFTCGVIDGYLRYGRTFDRISEHRANELARRLDKALVDGTYAVMIPQFFVTRSPLTDYCTPRGQRARSCLEVLREVRAPTARSCDNASSSRTDLRARQS